MVRSLMGAQSSNRAKMKSVRRNYGLIYSLILTSRQKKKIMICGGTRNNAISL